MQAREKVQKSRFAVFSNDLRLRRGEKLQAVVARSAFQSQNLQTTTPSDHFWKLGCRKSARRCGVKQILKSKWTNHLRIGPFLGIELSKKMHAVLGQSRFRSQKCNKQTGPEQDVEKVHAVVASQNVQNTTCPDHF